MDGKNKGLKNCWTGFYLQGLSYQIARQ